MYYLRLSFLFGAVHNKMASVSYERNIIFFSLQNIQRKKIQSQKQVTSDSQHVVIH